MFPCCYTKRIVGFTGQSAVNYEFLVWCDNCRLFVQIIEESSVCITCFILLFYVLLGVVVGVDGVFAVVGGGDGGVPVGINN